MKNYLFNILIFLSITCFSHESVNLRNKKVLICGILTDGAKDFFDTYRGIQKVRTLFNDSRVILLEYDSKDETKVFYECWKFYDEKVTFISKSLRSYNHFLNSNYFGQTQYELYAQARNELLKEAYKKDYFDYDFLMMIDLKCYASIDEKAIKNSMENPQRDWDAIFASGLEDLSSLRSSNYPYGIESIGNNHYLRNLDYIRKKYSAELLKDRWIQVDSGYGGIAIYKLEAIRGSFYSGFFTEELLEKTHDYLRSGAYKQKGNYDEMVESHQNRIFEFLYITRNKNNNVFVSEHLNFHLDIQKKGFNRFFVDASLAREIKY
jgi:hypothetical protein